MDASRVCEQDATSQLLYPHVYIVAAALMEKCDRVRFYFPSSAGSWIFKLQ